MEVDPQIYEFGQSLLNNFDKERAEGILSKKMKELENQIDQQENNLLKPTDKGNYILFKSLFTKKPYFCY